ncbi:MAG: Asp-tRNA(Asn)/Glu-tRNA(Gln) amidotransferase subunit GatC [Candidatus Giovannonibacteria bacterium]|nr:Asp-tRNA(Asn)/Glu-tRNA(Gln) amidotransferase subunit GatC [Candidatus Giovannonibacteria bacterium]
MISKAEIEHLKDLARVEFGAKETEKLAKDLGEILEYVDKLKSADVSNAPEMTHALEGVKNIMRLDSDKKSELSKELIDAFPEKENNYLKVKAIL